MTYRDAVIWASNHFLCAPLPSYWESMTEEELHLYITHVIWQPLEYHEPSEVFEYIDNLAHSAMHLCVAERDNNDNSEQ